MKQNLCISSVFLSMLLALPGIAVGAGGHVDVSIERAKMTHRQPQLSDEDVLFRLTDRINAVRIERGEQALTTKQIQDRLEIDSAQMEILRRGLDPFAIDFTETTWKVVPKPPEASEGEPSSPGAPRS